MALKYDNSQKQDAQEAEMKINDVLQNTLDRTLGYAGIFLIVAISWQSERWQRLACQFAR